MASSVSGAYATPITTDAPMSERFIRFRLRVRIPRLRRVHLQREAGMIFLEFEKVLFELPIKKSTAGRSSFLRTGRAILSHLAVQSVVHLKKDGRRVYA